MFCSVLCSMVKIFSCSVLFCVLMSKKFSCSVLFYVLVPFLCSHCSSNNQSWANTDTKNFETLDTDADTDIKKFNNGCYRVNTVGLSESAWSYMTDRSR